MIKILKSNKIALYFLLFICLVFLTNPSLYIQSCLNGVSVWAFKVLPALFPFFVFTRLIINLYDTKNSKLDKLFCKAYNSPQGSLFLFLLSVLSGYPMGAKLISTLYSNKQINSKQATKLLSLCSVSGPMFMIGTVGIAIFNNFKAGVIILIVNIISAMINGLLYRGKAVDCNKTANYSPNKKLSLSEVVADSLQSILMVGAYIILSFLIIDLIKNLPIFHHLLDIICSVFNINGIADIISAISSGIFEITRGCVDLNNTILSLKTKTIFASTFIGFGGVSIILQSSSFLSNMHIPTTTIVKQKLTQALLCLIISIPLCILFL